MTRDVVEDIAEHAGLASRRKHAGFRTLARHMAQSARVARNAVMAAFAEGATTPSVERLRQAYRKDVDADASAGQFADTLAQVAVYALFVARCLHEGAELFSRADLRNLPARHPFLEMLFELLSGSALAHETCVAALDKLVDALARTDVSSLADEGKREELISAFYEAVLREYDPPLRSKRGVYLTPEPVVGYLVRSMYALLERGFGVTHGLATCDPIVRLTVEDPACGTGNFLARALAHIEANHLSHGSLRGATSEPLDSPIVALRGCELLPTPYLLAHLLIGLQLDSYTSFPREHLSITRGNALAALDSGFDTIRPHQRRAFARDAGWRDAVATLPAARSNRARDILVMIGNPPYHGHSANSGRGITNLLHGRAPDGSETDSYFAVDGVPLAERNCKWLLDDYVKFVRYAQWRIERAGQGILAFVTNSGYLEGPIFRGMRRSLLRSFDELYVLDLHGDSRRLEQSRTAPGEGAARHDENVFAIQQGVALALFVRREDTQERSRVGQIWRADLRGSREEKLAWLAAHVVADTPWQAVQPQPPLFSFTVRSHRVDAEAESWLLTAVMPEHSLGVLTKRDRLAIGFEPDASLARVADFADPARSDAECASAFGLPLRDRDRWDLARARAQFASGIRPEALRPYTYRPLDTRYVYYDSHLVARPNARVMRHLDAHPDNLALAVGRQGAATGSATWDVAFVTAGLTDQNLFRRGGACVFPLYLYRDDTPDDATSKPTRRANLAPEFVAQLAARLRLRWIEDGGGDLLVTFGPDDVLAYLYALLFAPSFRARHADALRADFPRIPLPSDTESFRALSSFGSQLVALHLGRRMPVALPRFVGSGNTRVERVSYLPGHTDQASGAVEINANQRFEGAGREAWELTIGGYQVARKWLLDRRGRCLSAQDVKRYRQVVGVLEETCEMMRRIDVALAPSG